MRAIAFDFYIDQKVPWGPHFGLVMKLHAAPMDVRVRMPKMPKKVVLQNEVLEVQKGVKRRQKSEAAVGGG